MPEPLIETLIEGLDSFELVRDQIAAILKVESERQQVLAEQAGHQSTKPWKLRVFSERALPWEEYIDAPDRDIEGDDRHVPIVNVRFDTDSIDLGASNVVERQKYDAVYNIDCYGYGKSYGTETGHEPGDELAALECHRAMRLVRRILMSAHYTYLGFPRGANQLVWSRMLQSRTVLQPQLETRAVQNIVGARLSLRVAMSEFSPQWQGNPLELVSVAVHRAETGEIYLNASYELANN